MTHMDNELRDIIAKHIHDGETLSLEGSEHVAEAIIAEYGLEIRRDNLSGNGYRVIGKFIED